MLITAKNLLGVECMWRKWVHVGLWSLRQLSWGLLKICSNFYAACGMANPIKASHLLTDETLPFFTYLSKIFL